MFIRSESDPEKTILKNLEKKIPVYISGYKPPEYKPEPQLFCELSLNDDVRPHHEHVHD